MRKLIRNLIAAAFVAIPFGSASAATTLNVYIKDQFDAPVGSVTVAAIEFGMNGPSIYTKAGITDSNGRVVLPLENNKSFNLYYSSHGYSPSISDQFNDPEYDPNRYVYTTGDERYSTFTVTSGLTGVGRIVQPFTGATAAAVLFGGVYNMRSQQQGGTGIVFTDGFGAGTLAVDNVPFAPANTYNIGMYDPEQNRGIGRNVTLPLNEGSSLIEFASSDFSLAVPPTRVDNTAAQNSDGSSSLSVEGVVQETDYSTNTIAHMGLNFRYCHPGRGNSNIWTNSDENGRFQMFDLLPGVTYYAEVMGGCSWNQSGPAGCFAPYRNPGLTEELCVTNPPPPAPGVNDFIYASSSNVKYVRINLSPMPKSIGTIAVHVKSASGVAIPNANVNIRPDGSAWNTNVCVSTGNGTASPNPGFANQNVQVSATGYALLDGLPPGNYEISVWTPFSKNGGNNSIGAGVNGIFSYDWGGGHCDQTDDFRITVNTNTYPNLEVYDYKGVQLSSTSILVEINTDSNNSGVVSGVLNFSSIADLRADPVSITLNPDCGMDGGSCGQGNFAMINSSGAASYAYSINVSSGFSYWMDVRAKNWGRVNRGGGDNTVNLKGSASFVVNMDFAPAGTVMGTVYKPDGTIFTPSYNQWIWVSAGSNNGWTGAQLQKDGSFTMNDVLPGVNDISINASGDTAFNYAMPSPAPTVTVAVNSTATVNVNLVKANYVGIDLNPAWTPDQSLIMSRYDAILGFKVIPLPAGSVFKSETISNMLAGKGDDQLRFRYSPATDADTEGPCGKSWPGGFCAIGLPSPSVYDFYLMHAGEFGDMSSTTTISNRPYPHFTLFSSSKNVIVDDAHATASVRPAYSMSASSGVLVNLTPASNMSGRGNTRLTGAVTAANFFRQSDYEATGGDFDKFVMYLPVVTLYDANGAFKAAGIVVPPPSFIQEHDQEFNTAFAQGYAAFKSLLESVPNAAFGYEIRSLAPSTCYTAVLTTPNYPPYQTKVCMGAAGTTRTVNVNLDLAVGKGATLQGVVKTTATVPSYIANAAVEISGENIDPRTVVTSSSSGAYKFEGLPEGVVRVKVSASGYALGEVEAELSGENTVTQNFSLSAAPGSITGTVYSQKLPYAKVQPGALIYAYDDTYNGTHDVVPLLKTRTGADGAYKLTGLVEGDVYKIFLKVPGKYLLKLSTVATNGEISGMDFTMLAKPLDIEVFAKRGDSSYEFTVLNPQDFREGTAKWSRAPYGAGAVTELNLEPLSSGELRGTIPLAQLTAGITYVLRGNATSYSNKTVTRDILFGRDYKGNSEQNIDEIILGDDSDDGKGRKSNEAAMDQSGDDPSALVVPAGVMQTSTGVIPSCTFKGEDKGSSAVAAKVGAMDAGEDAFAGNLYTIALTSVTINEGKSFEVTLAYDKANSELNDLAVAQYNDTTAKWETVPGIATINPVKGTVKVKLKKLASVLNVKGGGSSRQSVASFNGREYVVRPQAAAVTTSGTFAVIRPSVAGGAYAGTRIKVFNVPNPFNLETKSVATTYAGAQTTNGTIIHVEVPAANAGPGHIRIYTLAGELVKDISVTFEAGKHNYVNWDGKNKGGRKVANGVYYGVVEMSGKSPKRKDATFKMAVIK